MAASGRTKRNNSTFGHGACIFAALCLACGRDGAHSKSGPAPGAAPTAIASTAPPVVPLENAAPERSAPFEPIKVQVEEAAMGTSLHFIAYTSRSADETATRRAIAAAVAEIRRLEALLSEWQPDSEISRVNAQAGEW